MKLDMTDREWKERQAILHEELHKPVSLPKKPEVYLIKGTIPVVKK